MIMYMDVLKIRKSENGISREGIRHRLQKWTRGVAGPPAGAVAGIYRR